MQTSSTITEADIVAALREVYDPEIPNLSLVDLGIYRGAAITPEGVTIEITPTFVGCPALEMMQESIMERCAALWPNLAVQVKVTLNRPWTSDQISEEGRRRLK